MLPIQTTVNTIENSWAMPLLPNDVFLYVCDKLHLTALSALAQVSQCCYRMTGFASLWQELCSNAKIQTHTLIPRCSFLQALTAQQNHALLASAQFFIKNIYTPPQIDRAHHYLNGILSKDFLEEDFKAHVQLQKARLQVDSPSDSSNDEECLTLFSEVIDCEHAFPDDRVEAIFLQAAMRFRKRNASLTDAQADQILQQAISQNEQAPASLRCRADYIRASLCVSGRTASMTKDQAYQLLATISQNPHITNNNIRINADLMRAKMRCMRETSEICLTDLEIDLLLLSIRENQSAAVTAHIEADFYRALLRYEERTSSMADEEADLLLVSVIQNEHTSPLLRIKAELIRADLRLRQRSALMTDEQTDQLLLHISNNEKATANIRLHADLMRADLRCQLRTDSMTDAEADELLGSIGKKDIHQQLNLPASLTAEGRILRAELHYQNRTNSMDGVLHAKQLMSLITNLNVPHDIRVRGILMLGKLCHRQIVGNSPFAKLMPKDSEVEQLLLIVSNNPRIPLNFRHEADLLRVRFKIEGRTDNLSEEEVEQILLSISQNQEASIALRAEADLLNAQIMPSQQPAEEENSICLLQ